MNLYDLSYTLGMILDHFSPAKMGVISLPCILLNTLLFQILLSVGPEDQPWTDTFVVRLR